MTSKRTTLSVAGLLSVVAVTAGLYSIATPSARAETESATAIPKLADSSTKAGDTGQAVLAGGCFWGMETVFQHVKGVTKVVDGYAGGPKSTANYPDSSSGQTNQAESVHIYYNPDQISYAQLLQIYFSVAHNPTEVNRQGPDTGHEYRSEVFALDGAQKQMASDYIQQLDKAGVYNNPIATKVSQIRPDQFYPAENYHQNYAAKHPRSLYIRFNDVPKVNALQKQYPAFYSAKPAINTDKNG